MVHRVFGGALALFRTARTIPTGLVEKDSSDASSRISGPSSKPFHQSTKMAHLRNLVLSALLIAGCSSNKTPTPAQVSEPREPADAGTTDASVADALPYCGENGNFSVRGGTVDKTKLGERCSVRGDAGLTFTDCPPGTWCMGFGGIDPDDPDLRDYRCAPADCGLVTCPSNSCCGTSYSLYPLVICFGDPPDAGDGGSP